MRKRQACRSSPNKCQKDEQLPMYVAIWLVTATFSAASRTTCASRSDFGLRFVSKETMFASLWGLTVAKVVAHGVAKHLDAVFAI